MESAPLAEPSFGERFGEQFLRWCVWIVAIGAGYQGGELLASLFFGPTAIFDAAFRFVLGVLGYLLFGAILGAVVALIIAATVHSLPQKLRTWRVAGIIATCTLLLGVLYAWTNPRVALGTGTAGSGVAHAASSCTSAAIATMFADFVSLDANPVGVTGATRADKLWHDSVVCDAQAGLSLSDRDHGTYLDALVFGSADSAYAYYSVGRYRDSRKYLNQYQQLSEDMRSIAQAKGWLAFLQRLDTLAPIMQSLDGKLHAKAF